MSLPPCFCAGYIHKANSAFMMLLLYQIDRHVKLHLQVLFLNFFFNANMMWWFTSTWVIHRWCTLYYFISGNMCRVIFKSASCVMQMGHMERELQFNEEGTKWITFDQPWLRILFVLCECFQCWIHFLLFVWCVEQDLWQRTCFIGRLQLLVLLIAHMLEVYFWLQFTSPLTTLSSPLRCVL